MGRGVPNFHWWNSKEYKSIEKGVETAGDQISINFWKTDSKWDYTDKYTTVEETQIKQWEKFAIEAGASFISKDWEMPQTWTENSNRKWGSKLKEGLFGLQAEGWQLGTVFSISNSYSGIGIGPGPFGPFPQSLGEEDPLEEEMAIHSSILAWEIPWTEKPGRLQYMGSQRVGHNWASMYARTLPIQIPSHCKEYHLPLLPQDYCPKITKM